LLRWRRCEASPRRALTRAARSIAATRARSLAPAARCRQANDAAAGGAAAEAIFAREREWVVDLLFQTADSPAYVKAKSIDHEGVRGADGFFDTIKNYAGPERKRVQNAWLATCGADLAKVEAALAYPKKAFPPDFLDKWDVALSVIGEGCKFKKRTHLSSEFVTGWHIRLLRVKPGAHCCMRR